MRRTFALAVIVLGLLVHNGGGGVVAAQDGTFMLYGPTSMSCGSFANATGRDREALEWWLLGFVSGAGHAHSDHGVQIAPSDSGGLKAWAAKYCAEHPLDDYVKAAMDLVAELRKRQRP